MLTPQDLQEVYFDKARFGGYSMASVDEFLEPLMADYVTLYKENAVLKSKMRLLVERLEAYRSKESEMKQAILDTQKNCDDMITKAERRAAELLQGAEASAQLRSRDIEGIVAVEQQRLSDVKQEARSYVAQAAELLARQQSLLEEFKSLNAAPAETPAPEVRKPYDFDAEADDPLLPPEPAPVPKLSVTEPVLSELPAAEPILSELPADEPALTQEDIASEIEQNVERIMESVPTPPEELARTKVMPAVDFGREDKFSDLQFGKNYDPTK